MLSRRGGHILLDRWRAGRCSVQAGRRGYFSAQFRKTKNDSALSRRGHECGGRCRSPLRLGLKLIAPRRQAKQDPRSPTRQRGDRPVLLRQDQAYIAQILASLSRDLDFQRIGSPSRILPGIQTNTGAHGLHISRFRRTIGNQRAKLLRESRERECGKQDRQNAARRYHDILPEIPKFCH